MVDFTIVYQLAPIFNLVTSQFPDYVFARHKHNDKKEFGMTIDVMKEEQRSTACQVPFSLEPVRHEMQRYYEAITIYDKKVDANTIFLERNRAIVEEFKIRAQREEEDPHLLKALLQETIADLFEPVIFPCCPFFFEMGVRIAECWGTPKSPELHPASFLHHTHHQAYTRTKAWQQIAALQNHSENAAKLWILWDIFDCDHHCLNYTRLLKSGVNAVLGDIETRMQDPTLTETQRCFLEAARRSNLALLKCATKFAQTAASAMESGADHDEQSLRSLRMIADAARRIPAEPPRTFYEGLAAMLFLREAVASLEAIGISVLGRPDVLLHDLYQADLAAGRLDQDEARSLIAIWMVHTDIKFHVHNHGWPETSTCLELGGCDVEGHPVFNNVTRLFIEEHERHGLINPKLNCRYGRTSPDEYLQLMGATIERGHNNFAFLNDDVLIPANIKGGKTERHARNYVNGGCQETMCEGVEHSAGAFYYFNMARYLDFFLQGSPQDLPFAFEQADGRFKTFEDLYESFLSSLKYAIHYGGELARSLAVDFWKYHPGPLFSSAIKGCVDRAKDYTCGGALYNPATVAMVGFASVADSLFAIRQSIFKAPFLSWPALMKALARNWEDDETLRQRMMALPKFGHGHEEADAFAARLAADLAAIICAMQNERGGFYQPSFFVYYMFVIMGQHVRATPDGRRNGDMLSQGTSPARLRTPENISAILQGIRHVDYTQYPANAVLDLNLGKDLAAGEIVAPLLRAFAQYGGATLQLNCVDQQQLRDAQVHPDAHRDLTVRISGLSARFVCLHKELQDEIIARHCY